MKVPAIDPDEWNDAPRDELERWFVENTHLSAEEIEYHAEMIREHLDPLLQ